MANDSSFATPGTVAGEPSAGRYIYCFVEGELPVNLGNIGIDNLPVRGISDSGVTALVSNVPYKQMESNLQQVMAHQHVVDEARKSESSVVLPVRFGVIINGEIGVRKLLQTSAAKYREKMRQLHHKDEYGVKVILNKDDLAKFRKTVELESESIRKLKDDIASAANSGRAYFLKMKLQDAIKTETLKRVETVSSTIHRELSLVSSSSTMLKSDVSQVILNVSYLVDRNNTLPFEQKVAELTQRFAASGLELHKSGPWAPYSFC